MDPLSLPCFDHILSYLSPFCLCRLRSVSTIWNEFCYYRIQKSKKMSFYLTELNKFMFKNGQDDFQHQSSQSFSLNFQIFCDYENECIKLFSKSFKKSFVLTNDFEFIEGISNWNISSLFFHNGKLFIFVDFSQNILKINFCPSESKVEANWIFKTYWNHLNRHLGIKRILNHNRRTFADNSYFVELGHDKDIRLNIFVYKNTKRIFSQNCVSFLHSIPDCSNIGSFKCNKHAFVMNRFYDIFILWYGDSKKRFVCVSKKNWNHWNLFFTHLYKEAFFIVRNSRFDSSRVYVFKINQNQTYEFFVIYTNIVPQLVFFEKQFMKIDGYDSFNLLSFSYKLLTVEDFKVYCDINQIYVN